LAGLSAGLSSSRASNRLEDPGRLSKYPGWLSISGCIQPFVGSSKGRIRQMALAASEASVALYQAGGRAVRKEGVLGRIGLRRDQGWGQLVCQFLAQLHSPLIKGVDPPDPSLHEDRVLIEGYQLAQYRGGELWCHDHRGWSIAWHHLVRDQMLWDSHFGQLLCGSPEGHCSRLGQAVGYQQVMLSANLVNRLGKADQICLYQLLPGSPQNISPVWRSTELPSSLTDLPLDSIVSCCR